jgi:predicted transglutaminase-like cysteine proteinase
MVRLRVSAALQRSFQVLVISPLIITGFVVCAAVPLASSLAVLSIAFKVSDHHTAESPLASAQPPLWNELWNDAIAGLASASDRGVQISLASRLASVQPLLRNDLRQGATAALTNVPNRPQQGVQFIRLDVPTLAPMAFTRFCLEYPAECKPQRLVLAGDRIELNITRWAELEDVNRAVNSSIHPERNEDGLAGEKWLLGPDRGDCNDYAVTKRHELIAKGWPARTVLLSEVVTVSGEHHLVTVVRTDSGDLVLDNLTDQIVPWSRTPYRWVRIQMPKNPNYWASISARSA